MAAPACAAAMAVAAICSGVIGAMRALGDLGVVAGDGAGNDDVVIHGSLPCELA